MSIAEFKESEEQSRSSSFDDLFCQRESYFTREDLQQLLQSSTYRSHAVKSSRFIAAFIGKMLPGPDAGAWENLELRTKARKNI